MVVPKRNEDRNCTPKGNAWKLVQMWKVGIKRSNKTITSTTQNAGRDVTIPLKNRFQTRQSMFWHCQFLGTIYTGTMISGVNFASDKKFDQVYVTDFGGVRIYPLPYIRDYHTSLYQYFLYSSVTYHLQLDNAWYITRSSTWNIFLDKGGGIQILHSEPHSPFHKKYKMDIK